MLYLVDVDHSSMAVHLTRSDCVMFYEVLYVQCSGWDWWWYAEEWQWKWWQWHWLV